MLSPLAISAIAFVFIFGGALRGIALRGVLAEKLSSDAKDAVRLSMGLIGTIAALVLGLLIASAKTSYEGKVTRLREIAVNVILSDNLLEQYGAEALPFLAILVFWLAMIFASFSLFSRAEPVVVVALFVCSLSSACALLLIMEMDRPFAGIMGISSTALRHALVPL